MRLSKIVFAIAALAVTQTRGLRIDCLEPQIVADGVGPTLPPIIIRDAPKTELADGVGPTLPPIIIRVAAKNSGSQSFEMQREKTA